MAKRSGENCNQASLGLAATRLSGFKTKPLRFKIVHQSFSSKDRYYLAKGHTSSKWSIVPGACNGLNSAEATVVNQEKFLVGFTTKAELLESLNAALQEVGQPTVKNSFTIINDYFTINYPLVFERVDSWRKDSGWEVRCHHGDYGEQWNSHAKLFMQAVGNLVYPTFREAKAATLEFIEYYQLPEIEQT